MKYLITLVVFLAGNLCFSQLTWKYQKQELQVDFHVDSMRQKEYSFKGRRLILTSSLLPQSQQIIDIKNLEFGAYAQDQILLIEDVNFDGFQDVAIRTSFTFNTYPVYSFYLFDPEQKQFVENLSGDRYTNLECDSSTQTLHHSWRIGVHTFGHGLLKWDHDTLQTIAEEVLSCNPFAQSPDEESCYIDLTWKEKGIEKQLSYEIDSLDRLLGFYAFNRDPNRLHRLLNLQPSLNSKERIEARTKIRKNFNYSGANLENDEVVDINFDGEKDYLIHYYSQCGNGLKAGMVVYLFSKADNNYVYDVRLSKIRNPTINLQQKTIEGFYIGYGGGSGEKLMFKNGVWKTTNDFEVTNNEDSTVWKTYNHETYEVDSVQAPFQGIPPEWIYKKRKP